MSMAKEERLGRFAAAGMIPPKDVSHWRVPRGEVTVNPQAGERVLHTPFIEPSLSLTLHNFVRGLLFFYGIQLHHLNPNGILHILCFITLCECFLGTHPHWRLWKCIFVVKPQTLEKGGRMSIYGGVGVQLVSRDSYFLFEFPDTHKL